MRDTYKYSSDVSIYFETNNSGNQPVIFLHGFANTLLVWNDVRSLLPQAEFKYYFLDLKGFGRSSKPKRGDYSLYEQACIVMSFINAHNLENCVLIGHSYGGGVALMCLLIAMQSKKAGPIEKLILLDCLCYETNWPLSATVLRIPILNGLVVNLIPPRLRARYVLEEVFYDPKKITQEKLDLYTAAYSIPGIEHSLILAMKQIVPRNHKKLIQKYKGIRVPTLILWGENDRFIPVEHGTRLHRTIPGSQMKVFKHCGHAPHEEHPIKTGQVISNFLQNKPI